MAKGVKIRKNNVETERPNKKKKVKEGKEVEEVDEIDRERKKSMLQKKRRKGFGIDLMTDKA